MRLPRYRAPATLPEVKAPGFGRWLLEQLRQIGDDFAGLSDTDVATILPNERLDLAAGATRRVSPTPSGISVVLEAPSAANAGERSTLIIEAPTGSVTVAASPHVGTDGKVTLSLINGERRASFTRSGVVVFHSNGVDGWKTVAEAPAESGQVGATGPAGPAGADGATGATGATGAAGADFTPATGSALGYLSARVYVNAASARVGTTFQAITVQAAATWTTVADIPDGDWFIVRTCGSGGSGCSGANHTTNVGGCAGAGGGAWKERLLSRAEIIAALPVVISAALGGTAVNGITSTVANSSPGAIGIDGGPAAFGDLCVSFGGGGGNLPTTATNNKVGGAGGGCAAPGTPAAVGVTQTLGGGHGGTAGAPTEPDSGAGAIQAINGRSSENGGASGAGGAGSTSVAGLIGGRSRRGGGGGGASGGATATTANVGGDGGKSGGSTTTSLLSSAPLSQNGGGGTGGTAGTGAGTTAGAGQDGADGTLEHAGSGGGGGGSNFNLSTGGKGGKGGFPGGGSGAGGPVSRTTGTVTSGASDTGGDAAVIVLAFA